MIDEVDRSSLLVDHINAGLWLPAGGHVEPGEHPTADREAREELAIDPAFFDDPPQARCGPRQEVLDAALARFDPHYQRFITKIDNWHG